MGLGDIMSKIGGSAAGVVETLSQVNQNHIRPALAEAAASLEQSRRNHLAPALERAGTAASDFGKNKLGPALEQIGKTKLGPAIAAAGESIEDFRNSQLGQIVGETVNDLEDLGKNTLAPAFAGSVAAADAFGKEKLGINITDIGAAIGKSIEEHPLDAALIIASDITFVLPGIVSTPILWVLGWGSNGPRAVSPASAIQAVSGNVAAKGVFAHLQSAAMGGYGASVVNGVTSGGAAVFGAAVKFLNITGSASGKSREG